MTRKRLTDDELVADALAASRETRDIEFKRESSAEVSGAWCELLKDIAAMANSGGGVIVIGLNDDGSVSRWDPSGFLATDTADMTNILSKYVGEQFDDFDVREVTKAKRKVVAVLVRARASAPLVFEKPGTYSDGESKQKTAFSRGTIYFRHGAKSEPGSSRDILKFVNREVERQRQSWLRNIRKVAAAPKGSQILVVTSKSTSLDPSTRVRIVDDPSAPALARADFDTTHPHRQTEVIKMANERAGRRVVGPYEIQCIRKTKPIDSRPEFFHKPKFGSPQYSDTFIDWLLDEYKKDANFFENAKDRVRRERSRTAGTDKT